MIEAILRELFRHRRLDGDRCLTPCAECFRPHAELVRSAIERGRPLHLVLPGFPAKSPSRRKVLGELPDTADRMALSFLQELCDRLERIHPARLTLCSDGRVFSDVVGVSDGAVTAYRAELAEQVRAHRSLSLYCLEDALGSASPAALRERLCREYAPPLAEVKRDRRLFDGIHRFLFEDWSALEPHRSRSRVRRECKERAYQTILRSKAWGRLIAERYPEALRLSIHPQPPHAQKIGIQLGLATLDRWLTPWHAVAVRRDRTFVLMKRHEAERLGAELVYEHGRPIHFEWRAA